MSNSELGFTALGFGYIFLLAICLYNHLWLPAGLLIFFVPLSIFVALSLSSNDYEL